MDKEELKYNIMTSKKTDIQKLKELFDLDKDNIRKYDFQLYYAILGVIDEAKIDGRI